MSQYDLTFDFKINVGHFDLYFMVQWFCLISWSLIDIWTPYFGIMSQYDPMFALKIIVGHCDLYFMVRLFCHILKTFWCMNTILWYYESVWPDVLCKNKCRSLWPIFHGPVILSNIYCLMYEQHTSGLWVRIMSQYDLIFDLKINVGRFGLYFMVPWFCLVSWSLFDIWIPYFGIMSQYDPMFDLKITVGRCDLYFMVQWFCLISWRLFDVWTSYFRILSQFDPTFDLKINVGHSNLFFSQSNDFALYLEDFLMYEHHTMVLWISMTQCLM